MLKAILKYLRQLPRFSIYVGYFLIMFKRNFLHVVFFLALKVEMFQGLGKRQCVDYEY